MYVQLKNLKVEQAQTFFQINSQELRSLELKKRNFYLITMELSR